MRAANTDAFGFTQAATRINNTLLDTANDVGGAIQRSAALLRAVHFQLIREDQCSMSINDVETLIELALSALPDGDALGVVEECGMEASKTIKAMHAQQQAMMTMLEALGVAADRDSTQEDLNGVADGAYAAASALPDGQRHWDAFCALVTSRGLTVDLYPLGQSAVHPYVDTPQGKRRTAKLIQKVIADFEELHAGADPAPTTKRGKRKA